LSRPSLSWIDRAPHPVCMAWLHRGADGSHPLPRMVKIFELVFLLEVTPPTIAALQLVFQPPITDTHQQYERRRLQGAVYL
jgi:hypothetical protein